LKAKKHLNILGDRFPLGIPDQLIGPILVSMALCSRIVRKKKGGKSGSPNTNQGKEVGNGKISLLTLASFCWAKKFVSLVNLANCCESNENENTPDV